MTLQQVKNFIVSVLKGWFTNKKVLDGFGEDENGNLTYDGALVGGSEGFQGYTDEQVAQAVTEVLEELNADDKEATE
jgi:hypothetical protein